MTGASSNGSGVINEYIWSMFTESTGVTSRPLFQLDGTGKGSSDPEGALSKNKCEHAQGQCLHPRNGFVAILAVSQDAGQSWDFSEPPAILFALDLNRERHGGNVPSGPAV